MSEDSHLFKATPQGWQLLVPPTVGYDEVSVTPDGTIFLSGHPVDDYDFYRSTDGGTTWHMSGHTPEDGSDMEYTALSFLRPCRTFSSYGSLIAHTPVGCCVRLTAASHGRMCRCQMV